VALHRQFLSGLFRDSSPVTLIQEETFTDAITFPVASRLIGAGDDRRRSQDGELLSQNTGKALGVPDY
jgi:hypothetical protein